MKISYNWIKDYLKIEMEPSKVAEVLTSIGLEVEGVEQWESLKGGLKGVVIGKVLTCHKHPDADKLTVTKVDVGTGDPLQIVCGAPNVAPEQIVPVATIGTILYKGEEKFEIKKSKIRGELSEGMICAEDELGLGTLHDGIMVLDNKAVVGSPASEYFKIINDTVFEIGLTPNRIDSVSHFGVARDLAAYFNLKEPHKAICPSVDKFRPDNTDNTYKIVIESPVDCPRYTGLTVSGVKVKESPEWLKNRLKAIGQNPINNVVDITNYVLHEIGQPLHAFDADKIEGKIVIIKTLPEKSKFITLDATERELSSKDLMICNAKEGMCIAGVFGGIKSGVTSETKNIFLESAYFNPVTIRKTSKRHGLQTDASFRFERGADPEITIWALKRAAMMIKEIAGGAISSEVIDIYPEKIKNANVDISFKNIDRLIGKMIDRDIIKKILTSLDITIVSEDEQKMLLKIPLYRVDVTREADVIEEILRIYGFNNVETNNHVNSTLTFVEKPDKEKIVNTISDMLSSNGFAEIMCNSLNPLAWFEQNPDFDTASLVKISNPLSTDLNVMRQSLLFGGLTSVGWNINRQNSDLKLYEFGNCYFFDKEKTTSHPVDKYSEKKDLDLFITGNKDKQSWNVSLSHTDFYYVKSFIELIIARLGIDPLSLTSAESKKQYFAESITYSINNKLIAEAGKISKLYLNKFDIKQEVYYGHIEWDLLVKHVRNNKIVYKELPKYPSVKRDLALLLDKGIKFSQIRELALKTERNILKEVTMFDVYENESLGKDKKSYAVSFILRDDRNTLTDKSIDKVMNNFIKVFEKELGAQIR
jgi:phenylalanyl-tRNA synthetase beta chain